jgi:hypothetical protein
MRARLQVGAEGEIVLPPSEAERLGVVRDREVEIVSARGAFAIIAPARAESPRSWMAGSLEALTVPEVVQQLSTSLRTGVLLLAFSDDGDEPSADAGPEGLRRKSIYFRDGQVVYATSADPAERLGAVLVRAGRISEEELERCAHLVRANRPLGQILVDQGVLTAGQVYEGLVLQVKEILLNAFVETGGTFAFLEGALDEMNAVKIPERTRDLLLAGMKRVEQAEELTLALGGHDTVLARAAASVRALDAAEVRLLEELDGRTVKQAARAAGLGYLDALRAVATLVQEGAVAARPRSAEPEPQEEAGNGESGIGADEAEAVVRAAMQAEKAAEGAPRGGGPFETYRRIFVRVHAALAVHQPDVRDRLNSYFARLPAKLQPLWEGVRFGADGDLDVAQVLVNVSSGGTYKGAAAKARALESLEDLLAFALFEVKNCLPRAEADALLREVGRMQVGKA